MIEIYLNIDDVDFWTSRRIDKGISNNVHNEHLQSSEILLNELVGLTNDIHKAHTLRGYMNLLSSFETGKVEDALKIFLKILEVNKVSITRKYFSLFLENMCTDEIICVCIGL